jgi:hypothetical protein
MPIPPSNVRKEKLTKAGNLSRARASQVQGYDRLRMLLNGRMELISD